MEALRDAEASADYGGKNSEMAPRFLSQGLTAYVIGFP